MCFSASSIGRSAASNSDSRKSSGQVSADPMAILQDVAQMKKDHAQLRAEMQSLRRQNERLERLLSSSARSQTSSASPSSASSPRQSQPWSPGDSGSGSESDAIFPQGVVIFDLHQTPATVLNASEAFCRMVGYRGDELKGIPWHRLVHPDTQQVTMDALQRSFQNNSAVKLNQLYRRRDGSVFRALDVHRIVVTQDGFPLLDVVTVRPVAQMAAAPLLITGVTSPNGGSSSATTTTTTSAGQHVEEAVVAEEGRGGMVLENGVVVTSEEAQAEQQAAAIAAAMKAQPLDNLLGRVAVADVSAVLGAAAAGEDIAGGQAPPTKRRRRKPKLAAGSGQLLALTSGRESSTDPGELAFVAATAAAVAAAAATSAEKRWQTEQHSHQIQLLPAPPPPPPPDNEPPPLPLQPDDMAYSLSSGARVPPPLPPPSNSFLIEDAFPGDSSIPGVPQPLFQDSPFLVGAGDPTSPPVAPVGNAPAEFWSD